MPKLLEMLSLQGTIVTVDALNCQRDIAQQIVAQGGDYVLALKGNQTLHDDVVGSSMIRKQGQNGQAGGRCGSRPHRDPHGQRSQPISSGCRRITTGPVGCHRQGDAHPGNPGQNHDRDDLYLISTALSSECFNEVVRFHWGVENRLLWRLDVVMNEDQARNRLGNGPHNLALPRHMALNVMQKDATKGSFRGKLKRAGWDDAYLSRLLALF